MTSRAPADILNTAGLTDQLKTIFILLLVGVACYIVYMAFSHKIGKVAAIIVCCLLGVFVLGIAAGGTGGISSLGAKLSALFFG